MTKQPEQPNNETTKKDSALADSVLERIDTEHIEPKPRWHFFCLECSVWSLWVSSIIVGAVAMAVAIYLSMHTGYALYEVTHQTWLEFMLEAAPILWVIIFVAMALFAYFNLRNTKKGYRYPVWQILLSSLLLSIVGGGILHSLGAGHVIEATMDKNMPMYPSIAKLEQRWWQRPAEGLMVGRVVIGDKVTSTVDFVDVKDRQWEVNIDELDEFDVALLTSGKLVKVIGMQSSTSEAAFHGCGVLPWMHGHGIRAQDMRKEREAFLRRMYDLKYKLKHRLEIASSALPHTPPPHIAGTMGMCPTMPLVKKMPL